jgi:hypothetical protein
MYRSLFPILGINTYVMPLAMPLQVASFVNYFSDEITPFHTSIPISFVSAMIRGGSSSSVIR